MEEEEPPKPTKALTIVFERGDLRGKGVPNRQASLHVWQRTWLFYVHNIDDKVECFDGEKARKFELSEWEGPSDLSDDTEINMIPSWPSIPEINEFTFGDNDVLPKGCYYRSDNTNAGKLFCPDFPDGKLCYEDKAKKDPKDYYSCKAGEGHPNVHRHISFQCEF